MTSIPSLSGDVSSDGSSDPGSPSESPSQHATISSTGYAIKCREYLELLKDLKDLGTDMFFDIPRITVIGGQSAGKSSLVEAVSGIKVPRDSGTCTRCPIECSMSSSAETWSCHISLCLSVDGDGNNLVEKPVPFSPEITDKKSVELWLRRAQAAILSPHLQPEEFYEKTADDLRDATRTDQNMLKFSKSSIQVEVKDPELTDLSFIDLPGLIQNSNPELIDLVRDLVVENIGGENTLILITIPMSDDIENQQAVRLARESDPLGERTIGVLTKPDTLTQGASGSKRKWKAILEGQGHELKHGYYCVRLPDDDERARDISHEDSLSIATQFFDRTAPWNAVAYPKRLGIANLVSDISYILVGLIEKNLPALKQKIDEQLGKTQTEIGLLPLALATDPSTEFLLRVTKFCDDFRAATLGEGAKSLVQHNRRQYNEFKHDIYRTCPDFRPFEDYTRNRNPAREGDPAVYDGSPLDLTAVQKIIAGSIGWELPGHVPFDATKELVKMSIDQWKRPSHTCFEKVFDASACCVDELIQLHFSQFKKLEAHISSVVGTELDKIKASALQTLDRTLELEQEPIFTQNTDLLASEKQARLSYYTRIRENPSKYRLKMPVSDGYGSGSDTDEPAAATEDRFQEALVVMATVRAYFQVTYKRIIDHIPLVIEQGLNQAAVKNFKTSLFESLPKGHDAPERTKELLCEDPMIARNRTHLQAKQARLIQIKQRLDKFSRVDKIRET